MKKNWEQIGLQAFWRLNSARPSHCSHSSYCESARRSEPVARLPVPWASPDGPRPRIFPYERDAEVVPCAASADKNSASRSRLSLVHGRLRWRPGSANCHVPGMRLARGTFRHGQGVQQPRGKVQTGPQPSSMPFLTHSRVRGAANA
jgi:hypothetical protein